jgi:hypothetical protein
MTDVHSVIRGDDPPNPPAHGGLTQPSIPPADATTSFGPDGTEPDAGGGGATAGPQQSWPRWAWRQLTSMRTALVLLFLLALGSVPGSVLPQEGSDPGAVQQYFASHAALAPWLNRLGLFNVFAAPWFAAIYLLLFTSLVGRGADAAAACAPEPGPAAALGVVRLRAVAVSGGRRGGLGARRAAVPAAAASGG